MELVFIQNQTPITDSLTIAEMFGKRHDNVINDIRKQIDYAGEEFAALNFQEGSYSDKNSQPRPKFILTEEAFTLVVFSYNTKEAVQTKIKFIQEFKRMREYIEKREQQAQDPVELALQTSLENYREIKSIKSDVDYLKNSMRIDSLQQEEISRKGRAVVLNVLGGKDSAAYTNRSLRTKVFTNFWNELKEYFKVPRYGDLPKSKFDDVLKFISVWQPSTSLKLEIDDRNTQMVWSD